VRDVCRALPSVGAVVAHQGDLQPLGDQILGETERDATVRRRDPEDVGPRFGIHQARAAVVGDVDRDVVPVGDLPGGVDPGAVGHDGDCSGV
jgi:hypothetical protein